MDVISTPKADLAQALDDLLHDFIDPATTPGFVRRLVAFLGAERGRETRFGWSALRQAFAEHELGRVLRTSPMVRRCQWRQAGDDPFAIVEAYARDWDDALDTLFEAEDAGIFLTSALLDTGIAGALRERRLFVRDALLRRLRADPRARILALGAGRAPELADIGRLDVTDMGNLLVVDASIEGGQRQRAQGMARRVLAAPSDWLRAEDTREGYDLVYLIDLFDGPAARDAPELLARAARLLRPGGEMIMSSFAPDMPALGLMDAVLDWQPVVRDTQETRRLLDHAGHAAGVTASAVAMRSMLEGVVIGQLARSSWAA